MADDIAIKVEHVSKDFVLPHEKVTRVKDVFTSVFSRHVRTKEMQHALKDVSFEIKKGEFFGIVGRNGSGKSTMLKMLAGIYQPTKGKIQVNGKLVPFIELGVGFNPELTGRENVYLNGAMMGFSEKQTDAMYDEIVAFAELEEFMDQKLKNYSSGMQVRLAFSVAIRAEADILVLDEVLAVGDSNFQKKCNDYFEKTKNEKRTVILVTHNMDAVERYCTRAALISDGTIVKIGNPASITQAYSDINLKRNQAELDNQRRGSGNDGEAVNVASQLYSGSTQTRGFEATTDKEVTIELQIKSREALPHPSVGIIISNMAGVPIFATNTKVQNTKLTFTPNMPTRLRLVVDNIFSNGTYVLSVNIKSDDGTIIYYARHDQDRFVVAGRKHDYALTSPSYNLVIE